MVRTSANLISKGVLNLEREHSWIDHVIIGCKSKKELISVRIVLSFVIFFMFISYGINEFRN